MRAVYALLSLAGMATAQAVASTAVYKGCSALGAHQSNLVFYPGSAVYAWEAQDFWSNTEIMSPACVFRPQNSQDLSRAVTTLVQSQSQFAVRGGGHMGIRGYNNIDNGVLIVMSNLTTMRLEEDNQILSLGPAYRWQDAYNYLEPYGLSVPGGRLGPVGIPGLLLAGGVNFYGNSIGWSCNSVVNYEMVLADGELVEVNECDYPDLFWALKGGSSNFGLVTRFDIETVSSPKVWAGVHTVSEEYLDQFLQAIATYSANISDAKSHIVPAIVPSGNTILGSVILFYNSETVSYPDCLKPFTDIPAISSDLYFRTVANFSAELGGLVTPHINDIFVSGTVRGKTYDQLMQAISITNRTFTEALPALYAQLPAQNISIIELDWQPFGALWNDASNARGGNALGMDPSYVYLCYAQVVEWIGSAYDDVVYEWVQNTSWAINNATQAAGLYDSFNYMGDSAGFQSIFPGYGAANLERLQATAKKYDPDGVFQHLMPGGFKVF